jgi:hypothetical protein
MIAQYLDVTDEFNTNGEAYVETSNYDYCVVQFVSLSSSCSLYSTIDSGAVQGETDGNVALSDNYSQISFTDLSDGILYTTFSGANGLLKVGVVGRYLRIGNGGQAANKVLVMLTKIG